MEFVFINPVNDGICVYIHFVMQIRSCRARLDSLLVIFASRCPFDPPLFMNRKMDIAHFCVHNHFVMQNKIMSFVIGLTMVIVASRCPLDPPLFMTPKMNTVHFRVYIHSVMQIRSCHARSDVCCSSSPLSAHLIHHFL